MERERGAVLVISGPSGVGKDTVINIVTSASDFAKLPTYTTRKPRPGEVNGVHYHFVDEATFISLHDSGKLLDHVVITGDHYGVPLEALDQALDSGRNIVIHLVVGSAFLLKRIIPNAILVFIMPPSHEELVRRLRGRGMTDQEIEKRLRDDPAPLQAARFYDFVIVNHDGEEQETADRILQRVASGHGMRIAELQKNSGYSRMLYMHPEFFATNNENKLREVNEILGRNLEQISVELFEPQSVDVETVVREKAEDAFHKTGKFVLVEDTSLEFAAWNGLPGALIKWFLGTVGNDGILRMLTGEANRKATAKTVVGFFDGTRVRMFIGSVSGTIPEVVRGTGGFGWDSIFVPDGHDKSFAEMTPAEKNTISMRKLALERMKTELK
ncbi:MAG: RdgB/HAM1 family non-canonical purine NTP pyrophosphatase [bacterium]|nr:RdgB/HAM1 family non-canonical purine NTP pyrophosphatase [bacterium]